MQSHVTVEEWYGHVEVECNTHDYNESTAGADASVEALKLYHMKQILTKLTLLAQQKMGNDRPFFGPPAKIKA